MDEAELEELREIARRRGTTVWEVVRQALRDVRKVAATGDPARKLAATQAAARHEFPTGDVDELLGDIERGRVDHDPGIERLG